MSIFEQVIIFCGGWSACEIFRFIRKEIKSNLKKKEKRVRGISERQHQIIAGAAAGRPTYAEIEEILRNRVGISKDKLDTVSFSLWRAHTNTKAKDLFDYIINGMRYPVISGIKEHRRKDSPKSWAFTITINGRDIWFHAMEDERDTELFALFEDYIKAGCPKMDGTSAEIIVQNARQRATYGGDYYCDTMRMFGFRFAEEEV